MMKTLALALAMTMSTLGFAGTAHADTIGAKAHDKSPLILAHHTHERFEHSRRDRDFDRFERRRRDRNFDRFSDREFRCVAVGRTIRDRRIPGTRGVGFADHRRRACRIALRRCDRALARRQDAGRNPFGRCVVRRAARL